MKCEYENSTETCNAKATIGLRWDSSPDWKVRMCDKHAGPLQIIPGCISEPIEEDTWVPETCAECHQPIRGNGIVMCGPDYYHVGCSKHRSERAAEAHQARELATARGSVPPLAGEG